MSESQGWQIDENAAEVYETKLVPAIFAEWPQRMIDAIALEDQERVLDVACGTGIVARHIAESRGTGQLVTGIDTNPAMLAIARRSRPDIEWQQGDVANMSFLDGYFDVVVCQAALMFFADSEAAMQEMVRVLMPGGRVGVQAWAENKGYAAVAEVIDDICGPEAAQVFMAPFALADLQQVTAPFNEAGLTSGKARRYDDFTRYDSAEDFLNTEISASPLAGHLDEAALLDPVRHALRPYTADNGAIRIPMEGHVVTSSKPGS